MSAIRELETQTAWSRPAETNRHAVLRYIPLTDNQWLLWARCPDDWHQPLRLEENGRPCEAHCGYFVVRDQAYAYAIATHPSLNASTGVSFRLYKGNAVLAALDPNHVEAARSNLLHDLFTKLAPAECERLFLEWTRNIAASHMLDHSPIFRSLCLQLGNGMSHASFQATSAFWLAPNILYLEGEADSLRPNGEPNILFITARHFASARSRFMQLSEKTFAFIAVFSESDLASAGGNGLLTYFAGNRPVTIERFRAATAYGDEFMHFLNAKAPFHKQSLRTLICRTLLDFMPESSRQSVRDIIRKLQLFIQLPPVTCNAPGNPFNIHFEAVIPIGTHGVFITGWMRDPLRLMETLEIHSALGFSYPFQDRLFRIKRPDVQQHFLGTQYGGFDDELGFVAFAPLPKSEMARLYGVGELHALHFVAHLQGGISYEIHPDIRYLDASSARDFVTKIMPASQASEIVLSDCIGPAASLLQQECMRQVAVREVYEMGVPMQHPRISLSIPLYKRLDFLKVQFATMANDPAMRECELVYVLDSPWQEAEVRDFLREYAQLYQLSVRLVVMQRNSGYAAASNTGAHYAKGDFIVLLNSDVFPLTKGWTKKMADFYASQPNIGALAPKLLYEDDSLQHAGMFFAKTTQPYWINLHYYKGYPRNYAAALHTRPVPAVTGACLMMARNVWEDIGMLSTDYVIGDFEDSDLCLKCAERGLENWYYADAELYHLERQSVPLNDSYTDSLVWRYNARRHHQRWNSQIERLMALYGAQ